MILLGKMMKMMNVIVKEINKKYEQFVVIFKNKIFFIDEVFGKVKEVCYLYVGWVLGGCQYVDVVFKDIEDIWDVNKEEVDKFVVEIYREFQNIMVVGLIFEVVFCSWEVL